MSLPKVSVILDNYNYLPFLEEAVNSVLMQTYQNFELILVDDGSQDGSAQRIAAYGQEYENIRAILKENGGQMSAFNAGMAAASGDIVAFLDSDDYWYPQKLEKIVAKHREGYQVVQHYLSNNGNGIYRETRADVDWHQVLMKYGYLYCHSVCSSLSFDRKLIAPFFPMSDPQEMVYCADGIVLMMALSQAPVGRVDEVLVFYRQHGGNGFVNKNDSGAAGRAIFEKQKYYVNKQLRRCKYPEVPFDQHRYFRYLIGQELESGRLHNKDQVFLYGTESSGLFLTQVLEELRITVCGYVDSAQWKWGQDFCGKKIIGPQDLEHVQYDKVIISCSAQGPVSRILKELGLRCGTDYLMLAI